jgi:hypothetical protein
MANARKIPEKAHVMAVCNWCLVMVVLQLRRASLSSSFPHVNDIVTVQNLNIRWFWKSKRNSLWHALCA